MSEKIKPSSTATGILEDVLAPGLKLVLCGTAPSLISAREKAYYAKPGNRFWPILHEVALTPYRFSPYEYRSLLKLGIGLTDLCKTHYGNDNQLPSDAFDALLLKRKILKYEPHILAFDSLHAGKSFLGSKSVTLGLQDTKIGNTLLFICGSTSGINSHWTKQKYSWYELAELVKKYEVQR